MSAKATGFLVSAIIFALLFTALGYVAFSAKSGPAGGWSLTSWLMHPARHGSAIWPAAGVVFGLGARYLMVNR